MITIPIAVHNPLFAWQLDLFWHAHRRTYGEEAHKLFWAAVATRNRPEERAATTPLGDAPQESFRPFFETIDTNGADPGVWVPLNIQVGLAHAIADFADHEIIEVCDCDMLHFRPAPDMEAIPYDELWVADIYEDWHLFSRGTNRHVIEQYLPPGADYNGGFVPIIGRARTLRKVLPRWTEIHINILRRDLPTLLHWWAGMYALSAACACEGIRMVGRDFCYCPPINALQDHHYIGHYCVDATVNKKAFDRIDWAALDRGSPYYGVVAEWHDGWQG